jgi:polyisoprenoid-binding protein YceI
MDIDNAPTSTTPQLGRYEIDPTRSRVGFRTRHLFGLAPVHGTFAIRGGTIDVADPIADSSIRAEIDAASFHTGNPQRDTTVRSRRYLDVRRFPVLTFAARQVDVESRVIEGILTVGTVTRPLRLVIGELETAGRSLTARASAHVDRFDFGITAARGLAGRHLELSVEVQCQRR